MMSVRLSYARCTPDILLCDIIDLLLNVYFLQPFIKVIKNKAYFKRYQVKFKRRRGMNKIMDNFFIAM
jgi:hypothetical protein